MQNESHHDSQKPTCVVVDTSVWRAEPLLKTPLGVTLVYNVHRRGGAIGFPEVVEMELKDNIIDAGLEAMKKAKSHVQLLRTLTDDPFFRTDFQLQEMLSQKVDQRLTELAPVLVREPFTVEHAKAALAMVCAKLPPNGEKNQQFKDSAIWQAVLQLSRRHSTVLLTHDKAFFLNHDTKKGLAANLIADCHKVGTDVKIFDGIGPYLEVLREAEPAFDREVAKDLIVAESKPRLMREAERRKVVPTDLISSSISAFPTENGDRLALDYTLTFNIVHDFPEDVLGVPEQGVIHGSCYFFPKEKKLTEHYIQRVGLKGRGSNSSRDFKDYEQSFPIQRPLGWE